MIRENVILYRRNRIKKHVTKKTYSRKFKQSQFLQRHAHYSNFGASYCSFPQSFKKYGFSLSKEITLQAFEPAILSLKMLKA